MQVICVVMAMDVFCVFHIWCCKERESFELFKPIVEFFAAVFPRTFGMDRLLPVVKTDITRPNLVLLFLLPIG